MTPHRDKAAAAAFLHRAIRSQGVPESIAVYQSGNNTATIHHYNKTHKTVIEIRQSKYLNNLVERDHQAGKRIPHPMLGFQSFLVVKTCTPPTYCAAGGGVRCTAWKISGLGRFW